QGDRLEIFATQKEAVDDVEQHEVQRRHEQQCEVNRYQHQVDDQHQDRQFRGGSQYLAPGLAPRFSDIRVPACFDGLGDIVEENPLDRGREGGEQKCRNDEEGEHAQHVEDRVEPTRLEEGEGGER